MTASEIAAPARRRIEVDYRPLGRTGIHVSPLCLGTMMFGAWGDTDAADCAAIVHRAIDDGINFIDTADIYARGESEEIVGKALRGHRDDIVLATKVNNQMAPGPNHGGNSRRWIMRAVEGSLRRLDTDWIDLYQIHRPDPTTDIDETLSALDALVRQGKVRAIGTSTFPAEHLVEAAWVASTRGWQRFATEQPPYSILARGIERDVLPTCGRLGLGVLVWAPLNRGWLSGKYRRDCDAAADSRARRQADHFDFGTPAAARKLDAVDQLAAVAAELGCSLIHLAIAFTLAHPAVTSSIIGPRTIAQLDSMTGADALSLSDGVLDRIDQIVAPGTNLNPADAGYVPPALADSSLRRRPVGSTRALRTVP
jgi:aryl-alcohol dehydrogenase-like predicted oxidoreductase